MPSAPPEPGSFSRVSRRPSVPAAREPSPLRVFINPCEDQAQRATVSPVISTESFACFLWIGASRSNPVRPPRSALILCGCRLRRTAKDVQDDPTSGTSRTHGAQRSTNFLMPGTDLAEQYIITQLSFLQAWYHLFRLWVLSPTYTSKFGSAALSNRFLGNRHTAGTGMPGC